MFFQGVITFFRHRLAETTRSALLLGGGTILGQAFILASTPVLSRLYSPEAFGVFGIAVNFISFASVVTLLRLDMAIMATENLQEAADLLGLCVKAAGIGSALAASTYWLLAFYAIGPFAVLPTWSALLVFAILFLASVISACRFYLVKKAEFKFVGINSVLQGATRAVSAVALGFLLPWWAGLMLAEMIARGAAAIWLVSRCAWSRAATTDWRELLRKYQRYPLIVLPSSAIDAFGHALTQPIIVVMFGTMNGGLFLVASQIVSIPAALASAAFSDVIHSYAARLASDDVKAWRQLFLKFTRTLALVSVAIYIPLGLLMWIFGGAILGAQWKTTELLIPMLCASTAVACIASPLSRIIIVRERQELKFITDVIGLILPNATVIAAYFVGTTFVTSIIALSCAQLICSAIYLALSWHVAIASPRAMKC